MENSSVSPIPISPPKNITIRRSIVTGVAIVLGVLLQFGAAWLLKENIKAGFSDFRNFYTAGKIVNEGKGDQLYDRSLQAQVQNTFVAPSLRGASHFLAFIHPPFEAIAYGLLARMPYVTAFWTLWACNLLLAYASLLILRAQIPFLHPLFGLVILAMALFMPLLTAEIQGQDSILTLLLVIACYLSLVRGRPLLAGFFLGMACFKPQQALLLLLLVMITTPGRWRTFAGFAASCSSLVAASALVVGWKATIGYPHAVKVFTSLYDEVNDHPNAMPNVRGLTLSLLQGRVSHQWIMIVIEAMSAIILILTVWILYSRRHTELQIRFSVLVSCVLLIGFYEYSHDFTPLLLPILLIWNFLAREGLRSWSRKVLAACLVVLVCGGLLSILLPQVLGCLVLLVWALLWRELYRVDREPIFGVASAT